MPDTFSGRIAWFTPLRPVQSGISLYNEDLLSAVGGVWPIDVFVDGYDPEPFHAFGNLRILPLKAFNKLDRRERYATVVYQFGNSPAHAYMYRVALNRPGIVVMHDTILHHLKLSMVARRGGALKYRESMGQEYGDDGLKVAENVLRGRLPQAMFAYPLSEDVIRSARHVIVHSEFSRQQVKRLDPKSTVSVVPMGIPVPPNVDQSYARSILSLPADAYIIASVTMINPYKRLDVVLRALRRVKRNGPVYLLLAGNVSPHVPLDRWIALNGLTGAVETLGFVDDRTARLVAAAADVLVNLRYPTAGETSASLLRIMAAGRPVLVSDAGSFREMPDDVVAKIPVDALEQETVESMLDGLRNDPSLARQLGANACDYVLRRHTVNDMVQGYRRVLNETNGIELPEPPMVDVEEPINLGQPPANPGPEPVFDDLGRALVELGVAGDESLLRRAAEASADLGLSPDKM
jgi:glycosyltransferase involved in cell wall biosynthesis